MTETSDAVANIAPFEGPEKLLEIWFAPSPAHTADPSNVRAGRHGLRRVPRVVWEDMLAIVKCQVLSVIEGTETDAYLLSESSLFVFPHRLILKTCGTTLNLHGLPRILDIARDAGFPSVYRCFYSRKSFFFPERQKGPHRDWKNEVEYLDGIFHNGAAYTVGKVNGDHWLLYMARPDEESDTASSTSSSMLLPSNGLSPENSIGYADAEMVDVPGIDYTIEILMTHLAPDASNDFVFGDNEDWEMSPAARAQALSESIGIAGLFPSQLTTLDAFAFSPCGYSSNALIKWTDSPSSDGALTPTREGYYTIHVTPEQGWSYASFECNVPLPARSVGQPRGIPDLRTLIRRVVDIFRPGRLSLTLFISSQSNEDIEDERGQSAVEAAQRAFRTALSPKHGPTPCAGLYKRTDKINYEFGDYDLAFASFELAV